MLRKLLIISTMAMLSLLFTLPAMATYTGNNNTPSADITDEGTTILYAYGQWGNGKFDDGHYFGISYGLFDILEIGTDWRLTEDDDFRHDPTFDIAFRYDLGGEDKCDCGGECGDECGGCWMDSTGLAIGVYNINFDEDLEGNFIPYLVYTHDFEGFRGSLGYSFEEDNGAIFAGFDAPTGDATVMGDWTQTNDGGDWDATIGFDMPFEWFDDNWSFCSFILFSSNDDEPDVWHVEFSYTFD